MNLKTYEHSTNYTATVIKLPSKEVVPGLDNLVKVTMFGNDCLISKDNEEGLYLFFPSGTQLSKEFLSVNNLYREAQLNSDQTQKGFFEVNGRVKSIKFKGVTSTGFVIPISSILNTLNLYSKKSNSFYEHNSFSEGDIFTEVDDVEICRKYVVSTSTPGTPGSKNRETKINNRLTELMIPNQFRFHEETVHLANNINKINPNDIIVITDKWHGSSCILSKVYINKKLKWHQKLFNKLGADIPDREFGYIYSSGKPKSNLPKGIVGEWTNLNTVDPVQSWKTDKLEHKKNTIRIFYYDKTGSEMSEILYREIFPLVEEDTSKYANPDYFNQFEELEGFGDYIKNKPANFGYYANNIWQHIFNLYKHTIEDGISIYGEIVGYTENGSYIQKGYDYGVAPGLSRFVVYRITYTKPDGNKIEFSWQQIKDYCKKYELETVKEIYFGRADFYSSDIFDTFGETFFDRMQKYVESLTDCKYCANKVPSEGIVVRIDGKTSYNAFKVKSKAFLKKESDDLDKGETNIEDNA